MGNCLRHESEVIWGGDNWGSPDEWGSPVSEKLFRKDVTRRDLPDDDEEEDEMLLMGMGSDMMSNKKKRKKMSGAAEAAASSSGVDHDEMEEEEGMKIKLTREEFEELMGKGGNVHHVLAQLMNIGGDKNHDDQSHQRPWRPALKSIPE